MGVQVRPKAEQKERAKRAGLVRKASRVARKTGKDPKRVLAGLKGQATKERNKRSEAAKLGWERKWKREGRKLKPTRKGPPAQQPKRPRPKKAKPPKPEPRKFARGTARGEAQVMQERLSAVQDAIPDSAILGPVINADNTVDAELLVTVPRGINPIEISHMIEESFQTPADQWITIGVRIPPNKAITNPEDYDRALGMVQIEIHSRRSQYAANMFLDWREDVWGKIQQGTKGWRKPEQVFIRLFWSPIGERPD